MKFYNSEVKEEFLNTIEHPEFKNIFKTMFYNSRNTEEFYDKDLFELNLDQISEVIKNINPATFNSIGNTKSRINSYINWAINNGRKTANINPLHGTGKEWDESFLINMSDRYLNETDMHDLIETVSNPQDQALIQCIFEGISGRSMSELISMNINDVDKISNTVKVKDSNNDESRIVKVSDKCIQFILDAYRQTFYITESTGGERDLIDYRGSIFKKTEWKNTKTEQVSRHNLAKRLYTIKEELKLNALNLNTISESGRIKMAADMIRDNSLTELTKKEFAEIGDQFNLNKMKVSGYTYYDTTKMKHYINKNNLKELYDIEGVEI